MLYCLYSYKYTIFLSSSFSFGSVLEQPAPLVGDVFPVGAAFGGQVPAEHTAESAIVYADEAGKRLIHDIAGVCCFEIASSENVRSQPSLMSMALPSGPNVSTQYQASA